MLDIVVKVVRRLEPPEFEKLESAEDLCNRYLDRPRLEDP